MRGPPPWLDDPSKLSNNVGVSSFQKAIRKAKKRTDKLIKRELKKLIG